MKTIDLAENPVTSPAQIPAHPVHTMSEKERTVAYSMVLSDLGEAKIVRPAKHLATFANTSPKTSAGFMTMAIRNRTAYTGDDFITLPYTVDDSSGPLVGWLQNYQKGGHLQFWFGTTPGRSYILHLTVAPNGRVHGKYRVAAYSPTSANVLKNTTYDGNSTSIVFGFKPVETYYSVALALIPDAVMPPVDWAAWVFYKCELSIV